MVVQHTYQPRKSRIITPLEFEAFWLNCRDKGVAFGDLVRVRTEFPSIHFRVDWERSKKRSCGNAFRLGQMWERYKQDIGDKRMVASTLIPGKGRLPTLPSTEEAESYPCSYVLSPLRPNFWVPIPPANGSVGADSVVFRGLGALQGYICKYNIIVDNANSYFSGTDKERLLPQNRF